jgi:2-desacetyl-2-hydroxyethyl bacteriochlorophyllide A dehydrogenase
MVVQDREVASRPGPDFVLIDVKTVGICGSDIHAYRGTQPFQSYPRILGHELSGLVSTGTGDLEEGQQVTMEPLLNCGECYPCRMGHYNCCTNLKVIGVHADGGMCEEIWVPRNLVHPLPPGTTLEEGAMVEPLAIACQAVDRSRLAKGETVLIIGAGPIGLLALQVAKARGATAYITEVDPIRLELARKMGADETINPAEEDLANRLDELTIGEGPNVVIEAVGSENTIRQSIEQVSAAGRVVLVGLFGGKMELEPIGIIRKELDLMGSRNSSGKFPEALSLIQGGKVDLSGLVTHRFPLEMAPEVFRDLDRGKIKPVKVLLSELSR